jgi:phage baseplate assembly protein V
MSTVPRSRSTDKRFYGVVEGLVTQNDDPDQEGKVRVTFPWFDNDMISEWCRILQPYAGAGYGMFFVPEVGDEVVIGFAHGDMRLPIILGGVYNGKDKPSTHRDASTDQKVIRTKGGHQILLDDSKDSQEVKITTNGGHTVELDDQGQSVKIASSGGHAVTLDDQGQSVKITTSGGQSITLESSGAVTISALSVTIDATSINLGQAAASSLVLGEMFMAIFNAHTHVCTAPLSPSGPPLPPMTPAQLSLIAKTG